MSLKDYRWWEKGIIYQIYPRSFFDSNADGVGDLRGIIARLDYMEWLGVDAIWLSPIYPSPMRDFGYDVSNYVDIDPVFGTLEEFDVLVADAHRRGLKVLLDFVPNHTSDQHPWFLESRSSKANPKRHWYIWRDAKPDGSPPNNWLSNFGGIGWTWDEKTEQYYYHAFLKEQPDLNWRNREVEHAMHEALRFWLDRGVDGFRVDVIWHLMKDEEFRDNPPNPAYSSADLPSRKLLSVYQCDQPEIHDVIARLVEVLEDYDDRMMVGEIYLPLERLVTYYGSGGGGTHLPFNFQLIKMEWRAQLIANAVRRYEELLPPHGWPNWVLGNHDKPRIASRVGEAQARIAAMLLLTLRGTPTMYYGDEIGMTNLAIAPEFVQDPLEKNVPGKGLGRDPVRTPMQWDESAWADFSTVRPWLPVNPNYKTVNVSMQRGVRRSLLSLYRTLIDLRRTEPALLVGGYGRIECQGDVLWYTRMRDEAVLLVALNLGSHSMLLDLPHETRGEILFNTELKRADEIVEGALALGPNEGVVARLAR